MAPNFIYLLDVVADARQAIISKHEYWIEIAQLLKFYFCDIYKCLAMAASKMTFRFCTGEEL